jgi:hypothetical protein
MTAKRKPQDRVRGLVNTKPRRLANLAAVDPVRPPNRSGQETRQRGPLFSHGPIYGLQIVIAPELRRLERHFCIGQ